jgi:hypothetical protein
MRDAMMLDRDTRITAGKVEEVGWWMGGWMDEWMDG